MSDDIEEMFDLEPRRTFTDRVAKRSTASDTQIQLPSQLTNYEPYGYLGGGRAEEGCAIYTWLDGTQIPTGTEFPWRLYMGTDFHNDTELRILLPHRIILIEGRRLDELRQKLRRGSVNFIQEFHAALWPLPTTSSPLIEKIQIIKPR